MSVTLFINSHFAPVAAGTSLFDAAESLGVNVPSSCRKQGKCRECLMEVFEGRECLTPRAATCASGHESRDGIQQSRGGRGVGGSARCYGDGLRHTLDEFGRGGEGGRS